MFNIQTSKVSTPATVRTWANNVLAAGGGFESNSLYIANALAKVLQNKSYYTKIRYLLPLLGRGIGAARTPLIDALGVGSATNANFVDADFSQSTGLTSNNTNKHLDSLIKPSDLGSSNNGGLGYWELNFSTGGTGPIGASSDLGTNSFEIGLRDTFRVFRWGSTSNGAQLSSVPVDGHYYGQRISATDRRLYLNATELASNTTSDSTSGSNNRNIYVVGANWVADPGGDPSTCGAAYMTDGTLTTGEITDLDSVLRVYLFTPTGRPTS